MTTLVEIGTLVRGSSVWGVEMLARWLMGDG